MTHLRTMMVEELVRRNFSESTRECYIRAVEEFALYFNCSPDKQAAKDAARLPMCGETEERAENEQCGIDEPRGAMDFGRRPPVKHDSRNAGTYCQRTGLRLWHNSFNSDCRKRRRAAALQNASRITDAK